MITEFEMTDDHRVQREAVRSFCDTHVEPETQSGSFPIALVRRLGEAGLIGVPFDERDGGGGLDYRSFAITVEELARTWKLLAGAVNIACGLVGTPLAEHGETWQREEWLASICRGDWIPAFSLTENEAGSDVSNLQTTAERDGDEWVIDGHKVWTTHGAVADFILVAARTGEPGHHGISLIGIPAPDEMRGVTFIRDIPCMEGPEAIESEIRFDDVRVPIENVVGEPGHGFQYAMEALDIGRVGTAAQGVGIAQAAFEASRSFADSREQFGRPIRTFQGIGFKIADMATRIEAARLLTLGAADKRDRGERITKEAAMAKTFATDTAMDVATDAVQIHGARGYSTDYPVERYLREAKGTQIYDGTNEINRLVIVNQLYEGG